MNWTRIKEDYVNSGKSLRTLARDYGISYSTLQARAARENWQLLRSAGDAVPTELTESMELVSRRLLAALEQASQELELRTIITKTKVKNQDGETTTERQYFEPGGRVDCRELKVLTGVLKDLQDVLMIRPALDVREQEARIQSLERRFTQAGDTAVTVVLAGQTEEFAK